FQPHKNRFQFIQREMVLTVLNAIKRLVGNPGLFGKTCVRQPSSFFSQELRQLPIQIALHPRKMTKTPSRMRDDVSLQKSLLLVKSEKRAVNGMTEKLILFSESFHASN